MLSEVTSLFDYFNKCAKEKRYHRAAIMAYRYNYRTTVTFRKAKAWVDKWAKDNVRNERTGTGHQPNCDNMTAFLNKFIKQLNDKETIAKATREANRLSRMGAGGTPTAVTEAPPR